MDREQLLAIIGDDQARHLLDTSEQILRRQALADKRFKPIISGQLDKGGKRLRPLMFLLISMSANRKILGESAEAAASIELVHQASLLHDQVIDSESEYDTRLAILAGDYLLAEGLDLALSVSHEAGAILARCISDMASGQALQLEDEYKAATSNKTYIKTAKLKTASLFVAACEMGALNKRGKTETEALNRYGQAFGIAFQIVDDYIDGEFPPDKLKPAESAARKYISEAKAAIASLPGGKAKKSLARLADAYFEAALPKPA
jgi:geranylgeranyl pyrophosphate synthase